jgi:hypothetical protein
MGFKRELASRIQKWDNYAKQKDLATLVNRGSIYKGDYMG